jgi:hypothetical protein
MKTLIATSFTLLISLSTLFGQSKPEPEYLIDFKKVKVSGFGNNFLDLSMVDGHIAYSSGGGGAFLFNYKTFIGAYSHDLATNHSREDIYNPATSTVQHINNRIRFNHGGLWVGYIFNPHKLVHWGTSLKVGGGAVSLFDSKIDFRDFDDHHRDWVGVITPEVDVEINIARWFKINAGLGYRLVYGVDNDTYLNSAGETKTLFKASQFSSPTFNVKFLFGAFGPRKNGKPTVENNID